MVGSIDAEKVLVNVVTELSYAQRWGMEMTEYSARPPRFDDVVRIVRRQLRAAGLLDT